MYPQGELRGQSRPPASAEYFQGRLDEAAQFAEQNGRYRVLQSDPELRGDDVEDIRQAAQSGLYAEQLATRDTLLEHTNESYEQLYPARQALVDEIHDLEARLEMVTDEEDTRKARIRKAARRAVELSPYSEAATTRLAAEKLEALDELSRDDLRRHIEELRRELESLDATLDIASRPWPVPEIIRDHDLELKAALTDDVDDILIRDDIPLDPDTQETDETIRKLIKEYHGRTPSASLMLTVLLIENEGKTLLPQDMAPYIYTDESHFEGMSEAERARSISQRIHRRLNQHATVKEMLEREGYVLQYGYRHFINRFTGKRIQPKRRIYRAVRRPIDQELPATFVETVDPAMEPEATIPMIVRQADLLKEVNAASRQAGLEEPLDDIESMDSDEEKKAKAWLLDIIDQLTRNHLLPEEPDATVTVRQLYIRLLQKGVNKQKRVHSDMRHLTALYHNTAGWPSAPHAVFTAADVVSYAMDREQFKSQPVEWRKIAIYIDELLEEHFSALEDTEQND